PGAEDRPHQRHSAVGDRALPQPESGTAAGAEHVVGPRAGVVLGPWVGALTDAADLWALIPHQSVNAPRSSARVRHRAPVMQLPPLVLLALRPESRRDRLGLVAVPPGPIARQEHHIDPPLEV